MTTIRIHDTSCDALSSIHRGLCRKTSSGMQIQEVSKPPGMETMPTNVLKVRCGCGQDRELGVVVVGGRVFG